MADYQPAPALVNPSFDQGLTGWMHPYRYVTDADPGFVAQAIALFDKRVVQTRLFETVQERKRKPKKQ